MRNMSFMLTVSQMQARQKRVTRRLGWWFLEVGDVVMAVEKGMGLKKGEKVKRLYPIRILSIRGVALNEITQEECVLEGFPDMTPNEFILMFMNTHNCSPFEIVNRIEFEEYKP